MSKHETIVQYIKIVLMIVALILFTIYLKQNHAQSEKDSTSSPRLENKGQENGSDCFWRLTPEGQRETCIFSNVA